MEKVVKSGEKWEIVGKVGKSGIVVKIVEKWVKVGKSRKKLEKIRKSG